MLRKDKEFIPDIRVSIVLAIVSSIAILIYKSEVTFCVAFALSSVFILIQGLYGKAVKFISAFLILFLLSSLMVGITKLQTLWLFATISRHLLIPLSFLSGISDRTIGMILEVFHKLHLPKSFGISVIVLMRFMPTIQYELNAIRGALKFRGVGISLLNTLLHLPRNFYLTLIPLLIRTIRISDEISAAALTRGIELDNNVVSFEQVQLTGKDRTILLTLLTSFIFLWVIEIKWGWKF